MRFRARIGSLMIGVAMVGLGLAAWHEWRRQVPGAPSRAVRIARNLLAERSAGRHSGRSTADSAMVATFVLSAVGASKALRAISACRADSLRAGQPPGR